jgi:hypothetical protein
MRPRVTLFVVAALAGGLLGALWNSPVFGRMYKGFIGVFMDPAAPLPSAAAAVLFAFLMGVPRICVP